MTTSYHRDGSTWIVTFYFDPATWTGYSAVGSSQKRRISSVCGLSSDCAISSAFSRASPSVTTCCATGCFAASLWNASVISICGSAIARTTFDRRTLIWSAGSCASAISRASDRATASGASCLICDRWRSARTASDNPCAISPTSSATAACGGRRVRTSAMISRTVYRSATCSCSWTSAVDCSADRAVVAARAAATAAAACPRAFSHVSWTRG